MIFQDRARVLAELLKQWAEKANVVQTLRAVRDQPIATEKPPRFVVKVSSYGGWDDALPDHIGDLTYEEVLPVIERQERDLRNRLLSEFQVVVTPEGEQ